MENKIHTLRKALISTIMVSFGFYALMTSLVGAQFNFQSQLNTLFLVDTIAFFAFVALYYLKFYKPIKTNA